MKTKLPKDINKSGKWTIETSKEFDDLYYSKEFERRKTLKQLVKDLKENEN